MANLIHIDQRRTAVAKWLFFCCAMVFSMVILGGVTRLTGSGLSMVDWRPIMGIIPPIGIDQWQLTFEMYKQSPEFIVKNYNMDLEGFKGIFWLEYLHRVLGRLIGIVFFCTNALFHDQRLYTKIRDTKVFIDVNSRWHARFVGLVYGSEWISQQSGC